MLFDCATSRDCTTSAPAALQRVAYNVDKAHSPVGGDPFYFNSETSATEDDPPAGWVDPDEVCDAVHEGVGDAEITNITWLRDHLGEFTWQRTIDCVHVKNL